MVQLCWYNFVGGFYSEFVRFYIQEAKLNCDYVVIDTFSGLGTTLVESNFRNLFSIGSEGHPFFHEISQAKIFLPSNIQEVKFLEYLLLSIQPYTGSLQEIWSEDALIFLM